MKVNVSRPGRYVPKWNGNRELEDDEQIVVEYTNLTGEQRRKYMHKEKPLYSIETAGRTEEEIEAQIQDQTSRVELRIWTDDADIVMAMKPRILNLTDEDGNPIDTWDKLLAIPQTRENQINVLVAEIETELSTLSKETDSKN